MSNYNDFSEVFIGCYSPIESIINNNIDVITGCMINKGVKLGGWNSRVYDRAESNVYSFYED